MKSSSGSPGHKLSAVAVLGLQSGTTAGPYPQVWEIAFQWLATSVGGAVTLGTDTNGLPLLINLIFEVQGAAQWRPSE